MNLMNTFRHIEMMIFTFAVVQRNHKRPETFQLPQYLQTTIRVHYATSTNNFYYVNIIITKENVRERKLNHRIVSAASQQGFIASQTSLRRFEFAFELQEFPISTFHIYITSIPNPTISQPHLLKLLCIFQHADAFFVITSETDALL